MLEARIALLREAIDEVAASAGTAVAAGGVPEVAARLAGIWAMVADLDPALAARLRGYASMGDERRQD